MIIVYDKFDTEYLGYGTGVIQNHYDVRIYEKLNGEWTLDFSMSLDDEKFELVQEDNFVKVDGQLYIIRQVIEQRNDSNEKLAHVQCEHIFYELLDDYIDNLDTYGTAQYVLERILTDTRFTADALRLSGSSQFTVRKQTPVWSINHMIALWDCEVKPDNFTVNLYPQLGNDYGVQFRYRKNLKSIQKYTDSSGVITRLYVYGKDDISIPPIDSPNINLYPRPKKGEVTFTEIEDTDTLQEKGASYLSEYDKPKVTYEVDIVELKSLIEYGDIEAFSLGDTVKVIDEELGIDVYARIVEYERYPFEPEKSRVVLANFIPGLQDYISELQDTKRVIDEITYKGKVNTYWLDGIINTLRNEINSGQDTVVLNNGDGILITDSATNPTKAMRLVNGMFALANSKDSQGNWNWRTFGTGDGFTADYINAGVLQAALVKIIADNALYIDGNGMHVVEPVEGSDDLERLKVGEFEPDRYGVKASHTDGSYTTLDQHGLRRYIAGSNKNYLYMVHAGSSETVGDCYLCLKRDLWFDHYAINGVISDLDIYTNNQKFVQDIEDIGGMITWTEAYAEWYGGWSATATNLTNYVPVFYNDPPWVCKPYHATDPNAWNNKFGVGNLTTDNGMDLITDADVIVQIPEVWVNLPDEWVGMDFNVSMSISSYDIPNTITAPDVNDPNKEVDFRLTGNPKFVLEVVQKETGIKDANGNILSPARFKVRAFYQIRNKWKRQHNLSSMIFEETEQNFYAKGLKFSYTVIA